MNANITIGSMVCVDFPAKIVEKEFPGMAVIKASPEMGFLVWLNGFGGSLSRPVTVSKSLGDVSISHTFQTVGNFYRLSSRSTFRDELESELLREGRSITAEECNQLSEQWEERHVAEPIRTACRKLGITKLWKHTGSNHIPNCPDLIVINLTERGPISIEVQC
jgi:hypothetical protein